MTHERDRFYAQRDRRTLEYGADPAVLERPVAVYVGEDAAATRAGQVAVLALVNMLARVHRRLVLTVPPSPLLARCPVPASDLPMACVAMGSAIDPFINLEFRAPSHDPMPGIGIGRTVPAGLDYYLGADRFTATLAADALEITDTPATILGGGLAACLAAAALFRLGHGHRAAPRRVSLWDFTEGDQAATGPERIGPVDVGDVLVVGGGAVGSALCYWLAEFGVIGRWCVVDGDRAELHNTNRTLGFLAVDAGWPDTTPVNKAAAAAILLDAEFFPGWYHEWLDANGHARPDLVLPLANDYGVRHAIGQRGATLLVHATTSHNWTAELHRHIAGRDDCIDCRLPEQAQVRFTCSTGPAQPDTKAYSDAALPFLSGAAGLLLAAGLIRLQHGTLQSGPHNHWRLHLELGHRTWQRHPSRRRCGEGCAQVLDESVRQVVNAGTRWAELR